jgi:outer membrane lipoprotein-sorting protein
MRNSSPTPPCFLQRVSAYVFALLMLVQFQANRATGGELDDFVDKIQVASASVSSFQSEFVQSKHLALFREPVEFTGRLVVARPDKLRWEFTAPFYSILILNGSEGIRCSAEGAETRFNLHTDPVMRGVAEQLWLWFSGDYNRLKSRYSFQLKGDDTLVVTPLDASASQHIQAVTISFGRDDWQPKTVEIFEPGGDFTTIQFSSYLRNPALSGQLFLKCKPDE